MPSPSLPPVALIAGPTASGKSALALALAEARDGIVINADSAQVYCDLRIVSARPSEADEARVPHRLYGYLDGAHPCSAADWAADARREIEAAHRAGKLPILAGGTGLYIRTLLDGIAPVPPIDTQVREAVRAMSVSDAYAALAGEDPAAAERLRPTDKTRIARALEVVRSTGRPLAEWQQQRSGGIARKVQLMPLVLLPPRDLLYRRCDDRFLAIFDGGGLAEVEALLTRHLPGSLPVMRAIGVPEIAAFLAGEASREEAISQGQIATRRYAKRQYTWLAHQVPTAWPKRFEPVESWADVADTLSLYFKELNSIS